MQFHFTHEEVHNITLQYFDTIPAAVSLCFIRKGHYLFAPCERGNHNLYRLTSMGKDEMSPVMTDASMKNEEQVYFAPRKLVHLQQEDELNNYSCVSDLKVCDLTKEGNP